jgi:DoxX-like protein
VRGWLTPRRVALGLAATLAGDATYNLVPTTLIETEIARLQVPPRSRLLFGSIKVASVFGLLVGLRRPAVGRLTSRALVVYFVCAIGAHVRIKDNAGRYLPAIAMGVWSATAARAYTE